MNANNLTRRSVLGRGVAGLLGSVGLAGFARANPTTNRIVVSNAEYSGETTYEFEVSGSVSALDSPAGDRTDGSRAWGWVDGWKDGYSYTGEITSFGADGPVDVYVNGTQVDPSTLGTDPDRHRIVIDNHGFGDPATYEFTVGGSVEPAASPAGDRTDGSRAWGWLYDWKDGYSYTGEITSFGVEGPVRVYVDGTQVDPSTLGTDGTWRKLVVSNSGHGGRSTYEFEVSGSVHALNSPEGDHADGSRAWGELYGWQDGYRFSGDLVSFSHDGPVSLTIDGEDVDPSAFPGDGETGSGGGGSMRERGTPLHDMDDWSDWSSSAGRTTVTADTADPYRGSTALRIDVSDGSLGARYDPDSPLDLSGERLSLALKWAAPTRFGRLSISLVDSAGNRSEFLVRLVGNMRGPDQGWVRCPVAADLEGVDEADLSDVRSIRLSTWRTDWGRVWIDDIRVHERPDRGKVAFTFDDSGVSRRKAIDILKERDVPGTLFTMSHAIGRWNRLTLDDLEEAKAAGWDVASHPQHSDSLAQMTGEEAAAAMDADREWLREHGFDPEVMAWPYGAFDTAALEAAEERYDLVFSTVGSPSAAEISTPMNAGRMDADSDGEAGDGVPAHVRRAIDRAEEHGELATLTYHNVDTGDRYSIPRERLAATVDYALAADVDLVTCTDLLP